MSTCATYLTLGNINNAKSDLDWFGISLGEYKIENIKLKAREKNEKKKEKKQRKKKKKKKREKKIVNKRKMEKEKKKKEMRK